MYIHGVSFMICPCVLSLYRSVLFWANPVGRATACSVQVWCSDLGLLGFTLLSFREQRPNLHWTVTVDCPLGVMTPLVFLLQRLGRNADVVRNVWRRLMLL